MPSEEQVRAEQKSTAVCCEKHGHDGEVGSWLSRKFGPSWRIRLAGLVTVTGQVVLLFSTELGIPDSTALKITNAIGLVTGLGVTMARQNNVSSELAIKHKK